MRVARWGKGGMGEKDDAKLQWGKIEVRQRYNDHEEIWGFKI